MRNPEISVVMSVYNGSKYLRESIESILCQDGVDLEFIIVNDGSADESLDILEKYTSKDKRIRIINQQNQGLTRSLINGCALARGEYIARQDADDVSLPGRLRRQSEFLKTHEELTLTSCWSVFVGPEGEELYKVMPDDNPEEATRKLRCLNINKIQGVSHHGSTMFRNSDYIRAGGYRWQFYFAQDLDLWLRLTDFGYLGFVRELLYRARHSQSSISLTHNCDQLRLARIIIDLKEMMIRGGNEAALLEQAESIRPHNIETFSGNKAYGFYFIGTSLLNNNDRRCMKYLFRSIMSNPLMLKAWINLLMAIFRLR